MNNKTEQDLDSYEEIGAAIGRLLEKKQWAYGHAFDHAGEILNILFPGEIKSEKYPVLLAIVRTIDKLFRIATHKDALGEDPWQDIAGYAILMMYQEQLRK